MTSNGSNLTTHYVSQSASDPQSRDTVKLKSVTAGYEFQSKRRLRTKISVIRFELLDLPLGG